MTSWVPKDTSTHQDHVIAHVLGTTVLGYFIFDEALYVLLDIGFVWTIFLDGEMNLLPHPVAIGELEIDEPAAANLRADIDTLLSDNSGEKNLLRMKRAIEPARGQVLEIREVNFFESDDRRLLLLDCVDINLAIETSMTTTGISVYVSD